MTSERNTAGTKSGIYASRPEPNVPEVAEVVQDFEKFGVVIDGGGGVISSGVVWDVSIPYDCVIEEIILLADQTGSIVLDVWVADYDNYPPTVDNSIVGDNKPSISEGIKSQDNILDGWTTTLNAGDTLRYYVESCTSIQKCTLNIKVNRL